MNGGNFDLQNVLEYIPGPLFSKYFPEKHYPGYSYLGPNTRLDLRLNSNDQPKPGEEPINATDREAYVHDLFYRDNKNLDQRHNADRRMVEALEKINPSSFGERIANFIARKALQLKLKLGVGLDEYNMSKELHHPIQHNFNRRKVQVNHIDEIHAADLMDFSKDPLYKRHKKYSYVLVNIDVFSKYCWCYVIKDKSVSSLIDAYQMQFTDRKPEFLWFDHEKSIDSREFNDFLSNNNVKLYHVFSEKKVSVAERVIRTLKEKAERLKTQFELEGKDFNLINELPNILIEYNNSYHRTITMSPVEASKKKNEDLIHDIYKDTYENYHPKNGKIFNLGDRVRIYKYKYLFEKGFKPKWTNELFIVEKVIPTKPITYKLKDLNGEEIIGGFYSYEMIKSGSSLLDSRGTTNFELLNIINQLDFKNKCLGVFMKDEIPKEKGWYIVNTEDSSKNGTHWCLCWNIGKDKIYYSSFGDPILPEVYKVLGPGILTSTNQVQSFSQSNCGEICVLVAYLLDQGNQFEKIILDLSPEIEK